MGKLLNEVSDFAKQALPRNAQYTSYTFLKGYQRVNNMEGEEKSNQY